VVHRENLHLVFLDAVNNAVTANDQFSNVFDGQFRHNSSQSWKSRQFISGSKSPVSEDGG